MLAANLNWIPNLLIYRTGLAFLTALLITLLCGRPLIGWLQKQQIGQVVRDNGPQTHLSKQGTPTMGGLLIVGSILFAALLWGDWLNEYFWIALLMLFGFALVGWLDDFLKLILKHPRGLRSRYKYLLQSLLGLIAAVSLYFALESSHNTLLSIPFTSLYVHLGLGFMLLAYFVIVGGSNAVNLTDGLDGLVIVPVGLVAFGLMVFALLGSDSDLSHAYALAYVPGSGEMAVICAAVIGASMGFLWFNTYPAQVFMGDVGALALGALLAVVAIVVRQEMLFALMGMIFVVETLSVIIQVGYFKLSHGKRVFKMAPLHHHFELLGWPEPRVVIRFWLVTLFCVSLVLVCTLWG